MAAPVRWVSDGGAGRNTITILGGSDAAQVAFYSFSKIEALTMTGGFAAPSC